jgi:hypothetical protein
MKNLRRQRVQPAVVPAERLAYTERIQMDTRYVDALIVYAWGLTVMFGVMYVKGPRIFKRRKK